MQVMRRTFPPYVYRERTRHGRRVLYFRRGKGRRIRLPDDTESPEFQAAYQAALTGNPPPSKTTRTPPHSLAWLIDRYMESAAWRQLAVETRRIYGNLYQDAICRSCNAPFAAITQSDIQRAIDRRAETPAQANNFLKAMRGLFAWALKNGHTVQNPAQGVERIRYKTDGFPTWVMDDVIAFRARHAIGTKARLAIEMLLLTGLRRSDIVVAGHQHLRGDVFTIRTAKTGIIVTIRFPEWLMDLIAVSPTGDLHFIVNQYKQPFSVSGFSTWFQGRCREAGIKKSAHGLRKLSATLAAEGGAAAHQLMAQFGWKTITQAETYTRQADRARLGVQASEIVARQIKHDIPRTSVPGAGKPHKKL